MGDAEFPSSQVIDQTTPIFHDALGSPLEIFVDPGAVSGRPKLVRSLRVSRVCSSTFNLNVSESFEYGRNWAHVFASLQKLS
jgi:hypothetical protein